MRNIFLLLSIASSMIFSASGNHRYDAVGNLILYDQNVSQSLTYDSQNRIIQAAGSKGSGGYIFSESGTRLEKRSVLRMTQGRPERNSEILNPGQYLTLERKAFGTSLANHIFLNG